MKMTDVKTKKQARQKAIDYQFWQTNQNLSYEEAINWEYYFRSLSRRFNLNAEFSENGLI